MYSTAVRSRSVCFGICECVPCRQIVNSVHNEMPLINNINSVARNAGECGCNISSQLKRRYSLVFVSVKYVHVRVEDVSVRGCSMLGMDTSIFGIVGICEADSG